MSRGAALTVRWPYEPQPISNQPGVGFPHLTVRYRPGGTLFLFPDCWSCKRMEGFRIRAWNLITPGCGGTSPLPRRVVLAARWLHEPQPFQQSAAGSGVSTPCMRYRTGATPFLSPDCSELYIYGRFFDQGAGSYRPRVRRDLAVAPVGNFRRALVHVPQPTINQPIG